MKFSGTVRTFFWFGVCTAGLVLWRLYSPYNLPAVASLISEDAKQLWHFPYFKVGDLSLTPVFLVKSFVFLLLLSFVSRATRKLVQSHILGDTRMQPDQQYALAKFSGYAVFVAGVMIGIEAAGIDLSTLAVFGGAIGIGLGFGLQSVASNFVYGLILLVESPVKVGDRVQVGDLVGDVVQIGTRATWVRTNGNRITIVPNSELITKPLTNWTANDRQVRFSMQVGVSYSSDLKLCRQVLLDVAASHPDTLPDKPAEVAVVEFGDSGIQLELRVWTDRQVQTSTTFISDLHLEVAEAFAKHGIEFAIPQRQVSLLRASR